MAHNTEIKGVSMPFQNREIMAETFDKLDKLEDQYKIGKLQLHELVNRVYSMGVDDGTNSAVKESDSLPPFKSSKVLGFNSCASVVKSMPLDQAIQLIKSDITGQPQTSKIEGELVVAIM